MFAMFYLLPKIYKRLYNEPGRPAIPNCRYYILRRYINLYFHLQIFVEKVKLYTKNINDFLKRLRSLSNLFNNVLLCSMDVVGFYPNIEHNEGLPALRKTR